ncbi:MAG TPA: hypothetical protein VFZ49_02810 [Pyrinomonadaceae bacterium]
MVRRDPVEAGTLHDEDAFLFQEVAGELLVVGYRVDLGVEPREHIQCGLRFDDAHAGHRAQ